MVYITGDTHIPVDIAKLNSKRFPAQKDLTKDDFLIICGDFGGVWNNDREEMYWRKWLEQKNFTTLFIDGKDVNTVFIQDVRAGCAYVPQDNFLFSDTKDTKTADCLRGRQYS